MTYAICSVCNKALPVYAGPKNKWTIPVHKNEAGKECPGSRSQPEKVYAR